MENKDYNWPMFVEETGSYKGLPGKPVHMQPGDMIIYKVFMQSELNGDR